MYAEHDCDYDRLYGLVSKKDDTLWEVDATTEDDKQNCEIVKRIKQLENKLKDLKKSHDDTIDGSKPVIAISDIAVAKIMATVRKIPNSEFMMYLIGDKNNPNDIQDVYIPKQKADYARVELDEDIEFDGIIGALHKHPGNTKPSFSGTDDKCLNVNHRISIVIPQNGAIEDWHTVVRINGECGCSKFVTAEIKIESDESITNDVNNKILRGYNYSQYSKEGISENGYNFRTGKFHCVKCDKIFDEFSARDDHYKADHDGYKHDYSRSLMMD